MFRNLKAEIAVNDFTYKEIAARLKMGTYAFKRRLNRSIGKSGKRAGFTYDELLIIRNEFFPKLDFDYLLATNEEDSMQEPNSCSGNIKASCREKRS